jgi:hypothetical protein
MKTFLIGATAAIGLALGAASDASAYWVTRMVTQWDPYCGTYVSVPQRVWVPEPVYVPVPVVVTPRIVAPATGWRVGAGVVRPVPTIGPSYYYPSYRPGWFGIGVQF